MAHYSQDVSSYTVTSADCSTRRLHGDHRLSSGWLGFLWAHAILATLLVALVAMGNRVPIVSAFGNSVFTLAFIVALLAIPVAICATIWLCVGGIVEDPSRRNAIVVEVLLVSVQLAAVGYFFS